MEMEKLYILVSFKAKINPMHAYYFTVVIWVFHFTEITVSFTKDLFSVNENNGPAQPVLVLSKPVDCCSTISVWVNIEEDTAKGKQLCTRFVYMFSVIKSCDPL